MGFKTCCLIEHSLHYVTLYMLSLESLVCTSKFNVYPIFYCSMNALKLAAIFLVVCVALAPLIDALEAEDEEVVCH